MRTALLLFFIYYGLPTRAQDPSLAQFFTQLCHDNMEEFMIIDSAEYNANCRAFSLDPANKANRVHYSTLRIMHHLFTTSSTTNGASGGILGIRYFWHYMTPNPRHEIFVDGMRNRQYTGIERKPGNFLVDLVAPKPRFSIPGEGSFASFGWCSEFEMSYTCLLHLMGYRAHVIAPGCHAWTEVELEMTGIDGKPVTIVISVDNTFDHFSFSITGPSGYDNIYDRRALALAEVKKVSELMVTAPARERIKSLTEEYIRQWKKSNEIIDPLEQL